MLKKSVLALAALAATAAVIPPGASAATVSIGGGSLYYTAASYATNDLRVTVDTDWVMIAENNGDRVTSHPGGCLRFDWGVQCPVSGLNQVRVFANDMHDKVVATLNGSTPVTLMGGAGNDLLDVTGYASSRAFLHGDHGDDRLYGRQFGDTVYGGVGNDVIQTGGGADSIQGGGGADTIDAGSDNDFVYAKDGTKDTVNCGTGTSDWVQHDRTWWGGSLDALTNCERRSF